MLFVVTPATTVPSTSACISAHSSAFDVSSRNAARTAALARSRTPSSSRSSSSAAISYSRFSVVPNIGGSSLFTVITTPASQRMELVRYAIAGVGSGPTSSASTPIEQMPATIADSSM